MALSKIKSDSIDSIDAAKIPNLDANKITTGTVDNARITLDATEIPNLDAAKITTGDIALARLGNAPATDTTSIQNDISLLALQNAINGNLSAYGLKNSWIEQFEDSTKIDNLTTCARNSSEFVSSIYSDYVIDSDTLLFIESNTSNGSTTFTDSSTNGRAVTAVGNVQHSTTQNRIGTTSIYFDGTGDALKVADSNEWAFSGDHTIDFWMYPTSASQYQYLVAFGPDGPWTSIPWNLQTVSSVLNFQHSNNGGSGFNWLNGNLSLNTWYHIAVSRTGNDWKQFIDGTLNYSVTNSATTLNYSGDPHFGMNSSATSPFQGYMDNIRVTNKSLYTAAFNAPSETINATGSFTSKDIVPQDITNKSSVGLVILYKDGGSSNCTLNTDIVAQVRANTGQAYQTLALAGAGTYSDSLKIAIAPAISVTAGQALSYKISFANQAVGTKEAQIHGVAMTY